jgi:hypothetical protein
MTNGNGSFDLMNIETMQKVIEEGPVGFVRTEYTSPNAVKFTR